MYVYAVGQQDWDEYAERLTFVLNIAQDRMRKDKTFYLVHDCDARTTLEGTLPDAASSVVICQLHRAHFKLPTSVRGSISLETPHTEYLAVALIGSPLHEFASMTSNHSSVVDPLLKTERKQVTLPSAHMMSSFSSALVNCDALEVQGVLFRSSFILAAHRILQLLSHGLLQTMKLTDWLLQVRIGHDPAHAGERQLLDRLNFLFESSPLFLLKVKSSLNLF